MTTRLLVQDFALANPYYVGATVTIYTLDENLTPTATLAVLYDAAIGGAVLTNPQVLDSTGKFEQPVYAGEPVAVEVQPPSAVLLELGIVGLAHRWRGTWANGTLYFPGERVRHPTLTGTTYIVQAAHIAGTFVTDLAGGLLEIEIVALLEAPSDGNAYVREDGDWAAMPRRATIVTVSAATYTPAVGTDGRVFRHTNAGGCVVTIPANADEAHPIGTMLTHVQAAAGSVTFVEDTGVTINFPAAYTLETAEQWAWVQITKVATNEWDLYGHLLAA